MPDDLESAVRARMAHAASNDLGDPWSAVQASMGVMDAGQQADFMERLYQQLEDLGYDGAGYEDDGPGVSGPLGPWDF
jgi:hypothetical protein